MTPQFNIDPTLRTADAICRLDLLSFSRRCFHTLAPSARFVSGWHLEALAYDLDQVRLGRIKRLIINLPPRSLKSIMASVALPAYVLGHDPSKKIIGISYGLDLAIKHSNDCRAVLTSDWYRRMFPRMQISRSKNTATEIGTTLGGFRLATSIDATLTGRGGDVIIIDDPLKAADASSGLREIVNQRFKDTILLRLDDKETGAIIVVMQRLDPDDLTGMILRGSGEWKTLIIPAQVEQDERIPLSNTRYHMRRAAEVMHPERESAAAIKSLRAQVGEEIFAAHYQQSPIPLAGALIKREWIKYYDQRPKYDSSSPIIQSWDTATTIGDESDWSVCSTWLCHDHKYFLIDVLRGRFDYWDLRERAIAYAKLHKPVQILVEKMGVGTALATELEHAGFSVVAVTPEQDKETRMRIQSAKFRSGLVFFPKEAHWLPDLLAELLAFPKSRYNDQVDTISQALAHEVSVFGWSDKALENFGNAIESIAMQRYWGRPW